MELDAYLERIGYRHPVRPDMETLAAVLRAHILSVPFENIDVQLRRPLTTRVDEAYSKIVVNGRGGWCYQQNGLFGWALEQIGFDVMRVAAAVMRQNRGDAATANHLCLLVTPPGMTDPYLADVGFGGSMIQPIPLAVGEQSQAPYRIGLEKLPDSYWRFSENLGDGKHSYDFVAAPASEAALSAKCDNLQSNPESSFVLNLVAQRRAPESHLSLRGRVFRQATPTGIDSRLLESADELVDALERVFDLDVPEVADLWPQIVARHDELFPQHTRR